MRFNPDNGFFRFLSLISDLLFVNILFLFTSLPIITIGPALTALYHVTFEIVRKQDPTIGKEYFKAFTKHFKQSLLLWLPLLFLLVFFFSDLYVIYKIIDPKYNMLQIPVWIFLFAIFSIIIYSFPLISTYPNKSKVIVKNALLISFANLPTTIFCLVIPIAIAKVAVRDSTTLVFVFSIFLFWGFGILAYIYSIFLNRIFLKIEEAEHERAGIPFRKIPVDVPYDDYEDYTSSDTSDKATDDNISSDTTDENTSDSTDTPFS